MCISLNCIKDMPAILLTHGEALKSKVSMTAWHSINVNSVQLFIRKKWLRYAEKYAPCGPFVKPALRLPEWAQKSFCNIDDSLSDSVCKCTSLLDVRRGVGEVGWCGITGRHRIGEEEWAWRKEETNAREHKSKLLLLHSVGQSGCFWQPQQEEGSECVHVHARVCVRVCMFMQEWVTAYPFLSLFVFMRLARWEREIEKAALFCIKVSLPCCVCVCVPEEQTRGWGI